MLFELGHEARALGVRDRDEVLDAHRIEHLPAEAFGDHTRADTLARGIDGGCRAGGPAADHEHVERFLGGDLLRRAGHGAGINLGDDLREVHAALAEGLAIEEDLRHRHDLAPFDFVLEQRAINGDMGNRGVERGHYVERLHDIGAVLAGQ